MTKISERIKEAMGLRNLKQTDLVEKTGISKGALSSYLSGRYSPKQNNIYLLAKALSVNEAWLMGADVPLDRNKSSDYDISLDTIAFEITGRSLQYSPIIFDALCKNFDEMYPSTDNDVAYTNGIITVKNLSELLRNPSVSYDDKAYALKSIMEIALYDTKKEQLTIYYNLDDDNLNHLKNTLQRISNKLNVAGLNKVIDYATDLSNMDIYTKQTDITTQLNAAHERTDIKITDEMRKHDKDIMMDDSEWE